MRRFGFCQQEQYDADGDNRHKAQLQQVTMLSRPGSVKAPQHAEIHMHSLLQAPHSHPINLSPLKMLKYFQLYNQNRSIKPFSQLQTLNKLH